MSILKWPIAYDRLAQDAREQGAVFVMSVNHTGTWTLLDFLKNHPGRAVKNEPLKLEQVLAERGLRLDEIIHHHLGGVPTLWDMYTIMRSSGVPVLVPLRDPLQVLATRQVRHPFLDHHYIIDSLVNLAMHPGGVTYVPIDGPLDDRVRVMTQAAEATPWDFIPEYIESWVARGVQENTVGDYQITKVLLREGNLDEFAKIVPETHKLFQHRDLLRAFYESQGYRDLQWF